MVGHMEDSVIVWSRGKQETIAKHQKRLKRDYDVNGLSFKYVKIRHYDLAYSRPRVVGKSLIVSVQKWYTIFECPTSLKNPSLSSTPSPFPSQGNNSFKSFFIFKLCFFFLRFSQVIPLLTIKIRFYSSSSFPISSFSIFVPRELWSFLSF